MKIPTNLINSLVILYKNRTILHLQKKFIEIFTECYIAVFHWILNQKKKKKIKNSQLGTIISPPLKSLCIFSSRIGKTHIYNYLQVYK